MDLLFFQTLTALVSLWDPKWKILTEYKPALFAIKQQSMFVNFDQLLSNLMIFYQVATSYSWKINYFIQLFIQLNWNDPHPQNLFYAVTFYSVIFNCWHIDCTQSRIALHLITFWLNNMLSYADNLFT